MTFFQFIFKIISKLYQYFFPFKYNFVNSESNPDKISEILSYQINSNKAFMVGRLGATELTCLLNYLGVKKGRPNLIRYILGLELDWWWRQSTLDSMCNSSGFFPSTNKNLELFSLLTLEDLKCANFFACWRSKEIYFLNDLLNEKIYLNAIYLDPFWSEIPWTHALKGKKVLVIHPFATTIEKQYKKRDLLFDKKNILPEFELKTIKAIQTLGGNNSVYNTWFEALNFMKSEIDKCDFDICLIGCGAYGFPLAAHVKRLGKQAIHIGGSLQLLFGIRGNRWENPDYNSKHSYLSLMNSHWVRPSETEKPQIDNLLEGECYW